MGLKQLFAVVRSLANSYNCRVKCDDNKAGFTMIFKSITFPGKMQIAYTKTKPVSNFVVFRFCFSRFSAASTLVYIPRLEFSL